MKLYSAMNGLGALLLVLAPWACSSDDEPGTATSNLVGALGKANPPSPENADRIDRAGRPAITAALISTFDPDSRQADLERYNTGSASANRAFTPVMASSLAILDGLDGVCGNQLAIDPSLANPYAPLAETLVDDQVYVQSDEGAGSVYLGVEGEALGVLERGQGAGGGRVPGDDVIERSYSVLVAGALNGIDDLVDSDDADHDADEFPFLAEP